MQGVDASYDSLSDSEAQALRQAGVYVWAQCLWTGSGLTGTAQANLDVAIRNNLIPCGYISVTSRQMGGYHVNQGRTAVNQEVWDKLALVFIDVELEGIPNRTISEALDRVVALGKRKAIYTSSNAWRAYQGNPIGFEDALLWNANWDANPDVDYIDRAFGNWPITKLVGEQYSGGQNYLGVFVDRNIFDLDLLIERSPLPTDDQFLLAIKILTSTAARVAGRQSPTSSQKAQIRYLSTIWGG